MATHTSAPELATETKIVSDASGPTSNPRTARRSEPSVKDIIAAARSQPAPALAVRTRMLMAIPCTSSR